MNIKTTPIITDVKKNKRNNKNITTKNTHKQNKTTKKTTSQIKTTKIKTTN